MSVDTVELSLTDEWPVRFRLVGSFQPINFVPIIELGGGEKYQLYISILIIQTEIRC